MTSTKDKAVRGVLWNLIDKIGARVVGFLLGVVLARLLMPEDYGLIGMMIVFFNIAHVIIAGGFGVAYVQQSTVSERDANTMFYCNLVLSFFAYGVLWFCAPLVAGFYDQPGLSQLIRVAALALIANSLGIIQTAKFVRDIQFKAKSIVSVTATALGGVLGILAAYAGLGVWALVTQNMTIQVVNTAGLWLASDWRPSWQFSIPSFKRLFSFGFWILLANMIQKAFDDIYVLTIGKLFPMAQLGFFTKARNFQVLASEQVPGAVSSVVFPILSRRQHDKAGLREVIQSFLSHSFFIMMPLLVTLIVIADPLIVFLLTEKWAPMTPYFQLLCIAGILYPIHLINVQVLLAQGKSNLSFHLTLIKNALRIANVAVMYRFGVMQIIQGEIAVSFLALIINAYYTNKLVRFSLIRQLNGIRPQILGGALAFLAGSAARQWTAGTIQPMISGTAACLGVFVGFQALFNRDDFRSMIRLKDSILPGGKH